MLRVDARIVFAIVATSIILTTIVVPILILKLPNVAVGASRSERHRSKHSMPLGTRRIGENRYAWKNESVLGIFIVNSAERNESFLPVNGRCCLSLDARPYSLENYEIEAANDGSFSSSAIMGIFSASVTEWENVVGNKIGSASPIADSNGISFNGKNQVSMTTLDVGMPDALAITAMWLTCPTGASVDSCSVDLNIVEWDQMYDISGREWSLSGAQNAVDLPSVVVHEFGHVMGLDDIYDLSCWKATMYGYAGYGETFRRSLSQEDIDCVRANFPSSSSATNASSFVAVLLAIFLVLF